MVIYSIILQCDKCNNQVFQSIFQIPLSQPALRDNARKEARRGGWACVIECGHHKDYCPQCSEAMKMIKGKIK